MAALFDGTANQRLRHSSQRFTLAPPVSFGFRFRWPTSATNRLLFSASPYSTDADGLIVYKDGSSVIWLGVFDGGGYSEVTTGTAYGNNLPCYCVVRWISATNKRISIRHAGNTASAHAQITASRSPANLNAWGFGWTGLTPDVDVPLGRVGHFWMTFSDIQPGGGVLDNALLNTLAKDGPMAVPHIRNQLIEYQSFEDSLTGDKGDSYSSRGRLAWEALNGVRLSGG